MFLCLTYNRCFFCKLLKWNFGTMAVGVSSFYLVWVPTDARQQQNCISWMDNFPCMTSYDILWHYGCFNADLRATAPPISHRSALWSEDPLVAMHGKIQTCTSQKKISLRMMGESVNQFSGQHPFFCLCTPKTTACSRATGRYFENLWRWLCGSHSAGVSHGFSRLFRSHCHLHGGEFSIVFHCGRMILYGKKDHAHVCSRNRFSLPTAYITVLQHERKPSTTGSVVMFLNFPLQPTNLYHDHKMQKLLLHVWCLMLECVSIVAGMIVVSGPSKLEFGDVLGQWLQGHLYL